MNQANNLIKRIDSMPNFSFGCKSPALLFLIKKNIKLNEETFEINFQVIRERFLKIFPESKTITENHIFSEVLSTQIITWSEIFKEYSNLINYEDGFLINDLYEDDSLVIIPAPLKFHQILASSISWLIKCLVIKEELSCEYLDAKFQELMNQLKKIRVVESNVPHFKSAADELDIPVFELDDGKVLQYGQGKNSKWLQSSFTDQTPLIGSTLAKNKHLASKILLDAGMPVPSHSLVGSSQQAVNVAEKIGYPVVVKPVNLDGGIGVAAGLKSPIDVVQAFNLAKKYSDNIMVQKHFTGRDYRITTFQGKILWVIERIPAGVEGDGIHSIRELLEIKNQDPNRGDGDHFALKKIKIDDEVNSLLVEANKNMDTILNVGEFVALKRRANIAAGGMPISVMGNVHIDNERLAIRAAELLGLDLAGVDLLIPDISQSWMTVGAAICEINSQPTLGSFTSKHVYKQIIETLLPNGGRIPITILMGFDTTNQADEVYQEHCLSGLTCGYVSKKGVFVGDEKVGNAPISTFHGAKSMIMDRRIDALVVDVNDFSFIQHGTPFDRIDKLIFNENFTRHGNENIELMMTRQYKMVKKLINNNLNK